MPSRLSAAELCSVVECSMSRLRGRGVRAVHPRLLADDMTRERTLRVGFDGLTLRAKRRASRALRAAELGVGGGTAGAVNPVGPLYGVCACLPVQQEKGDTLSLDPNVGAVI